MRLDGNRSPLASMEGQMVNSRLADNSPHTAGYVTISLSLGGMLSIRGRCRVTQDEPSASLYVEERGTRSSVLRIVEGYARKNEIDRSRLGSDGTGFRRFQLVIRSRGTESCAARWLKTALELASLLLEA
jgi:hypothetical protein